MVERDGPVAASRLLGVGLLAGPQYDRDVGIRPGPPINTDGVLGSRPAAFGVVAGRVIQVCAPKDWVCDPNSRQLGDLIRQRGNGVHTSYESFQVRPGVTALEYLRLAARAVIEHAR